MARFKVFFSEEADEEVLKSYEWGLLFWGQDQADNWLRDLYNSVIERLSELPLSCPLAPESDYLGDEVRHYLFGRYRILFEIQGDEVTVIRLLGPYTDLPGAKEMALE